MAKSTGTGKAKEKYAPKEYYCFKCGAKFTKREGNFPKVRSEMYSANDGFLPWCKNCINERFGEYEEQFGTNEALHRMCLLLNMYWSQKVLDMVNNNGSATTSNIMTYIKMANLNQIKCTSYDEYLAEEATPGAITSLDDFQERKTNGQTTTPEKLIEKFGTGFTDEEYRLMESHYKMLTKNLENIDFIQETLIRDLCLIKSQQSRSIMDKEADKFDKFTKLYQTTLNSAKVRSSDTQVGKDDTFGAYLAYIESHCPADIYMDKLKYWDVLGTSEYAERHIFRPMKNWFTGSKDKDKEFYIEDETDNLS